ncbi:hypothetical protein L6R52_40980, partial [Myxococcota bacterium]|nr:hypothetical protein [Myxococcota bacterium]
MAGLDLPIKLRRGLGQGNVVPAEELARRLAAFDADQDKAVSRAELVAFLVKYQVGGPWFCEVVSRTLWKYVEQRLQAAQPSINVDVLGRIIHFAMSRGPRPERRYEITPEGMAGYKPLEPLKRPGDVPLQGPAPTAQAAAP